MGCRLSDHGIEERVASDYKLAQVETVFEKLMAGQAPSGSDALAVKSCNL